jgi:hypothetical protein
VNIYTPDHPTVTCPHALEYATCTLDTPARTTDHIPYSHGTPNHPSTPVCVQFCLETPWETALPGTHRVCDSRAY